MKKQSILVVVVILFLGLTYGFSSRTKQNPLPRHTLAPEIVLPQPDGMPLALSSLKGKYVLIDFWASWCPSCRKESKHLKKAYETYKDKGFTIYSVSVDKDASKWLKAIKDDGLSWHHVRDVDGKASDTYGIREIPAPILIDPSGEVIAQGDALLGKALAETLKKYVQ